MKPTNDEIIDPIPFGHHVQPSWRLYALNDPWISLYQPNHRQPAIVEIPDVERIGVVAGGVPRRLPMVEAYEAAYLSYRQFLVAESARRAGLEVLHEEDPSEPTELWVEGLRVQVAIFDMDRRKYLLTDVDPSRIVVWEVENLRLIAAPAISTLRRPDHKHRWAAYRMNINIQHVLARDSDRWPAKEKLALLRKAMPIAERTWGVKKQTRFECARCGKTAELKRPTKKPGSWVIRGNKHWCRRCLIASLQQNGQLITGPPDAQD